MLFPFQRVIWITLMVLCKLVTSHTEPSKEELTEAESKDKLEIVKQIKKVNDDGSYTIGYEADDGSFKIESRDVQGNIKGTYGFVDDDGEIKRVSYSTKNTSSESVSKNEPSSSVVQRIPRVNKTYTTSTRLPSTFPTQPSVSSSTSTATVIQSIPRKRILPVAAPTTKASSTIKANQTDPFSKVEASATNQEKTRISPTVTAHQYSQKSISQIARPEFATSAPVGRRLTQTNRLNEEQSAIKPVTEQISETHGNLLRRQTFDVQQHAASLRQSHGADAPDVYSASVTTGMPRVLFTTIRPTASQATSTRYTPVYHRNLPQEVTTLSPATQESTTTETPQTPQNQYTTAVPVPLVQIPPNQIEPLVAIRHPYRGTVVVPLKDLQNREQIDAIQFTRNQPVYNPQLRAPPSNEQLQPEIQQPDPRTVPVYVRRPPIQVLRSMPVQIDENGYVRELRPIPPLPYANPENIAPLPQYFNEEESESNDIENIKPPVSVQDFQKLLNLLIIRQRRLEQVSKLAAMRTVGQYENVYQAAAPVPYVVSKYQDLQQRGPVQFASQDMETNERRQEGQRPQYRRIFYTPQPNYNPYQTQYQQPSRRVARLLKPDRNIAEDYLPPDIREMLLLRMLQLAINPALPVEASDVEALGSSSSIQASRQPVRNVEILGEEDDEEKNRAMRVKRLFRES